MDCQSLSVSVLCKTHNGRPDWCRVNTPVQGVNGVFLRSFTKNSRVLAQPVSCSCQHNNETPQISTSTRRSLVSSLGLGTVLPHITQSAQASKLPGFFDKAWEAIGGGPSDLYFPESFNGRWVVDATLTKVEMPLGAKFVPDVAVCPCCTYKIQDYTSVFGT